jgi:hypothetical protein
MKKIIAILFLLFSINAFAQDEQKGLVYSIDDFSGGLNSKISPLATPKNQAVTVENIRVDSELKSISKRNQISAYGGNETFPVTGLHRFYGVGGVKTLIRTLDKNITVGNDTSGTFSTVLTLNQAPLHTQWKNWHNLAIGTDGFNPPYKYDGTSASATYLGAPLASIGVGGTGPTGTVRYITTFYTNNTEVSFSQPSNPLVVVSNLVNLTLIPIGPSQFNGQPVLGRNIYRNETAAGTSWNLISNGNITNNVNTTLVDSTTDPGLGGVLNPTYIMAPPQGKYVEVNANRLWFANNPNQPSRAWYSDSSSHDFFDNLSYFDVRSNDGDEISFMKNLLGILTIGKTNTIEKIYTDGVDPFADWSISDPFSFKGCRAPYTVANSPMGIIYLSDDGLYYFDGQSSHLMSDAVTPQIKDISDSNFANCFGILHKNIYYLSYTSKNSGVSYNNRLLTFDILSNSYNIDLLSIGTLCTFNSGSDWGVLYSSSSINGSVFVHSEPEYELVNKRWADFGGTFNGSGFVTLSAGGDPEDPIIELHNTTTIDNWVGTINAWTGIIDRTVQEGNYTSQVFTTRARSFDKAFWNPVIPLTGGRISFAIRANSSVNNCLNTSWSSEFTNPYGSDISGVPGGNYFQYRIYMNTTNMNFTPTLIKQNFYVVKVSYAAQGTQVESSIPMHWTSGFFDMGEPANDKILRKMEVYLNGTAGALNMTVNTIDGASDTFGIDMSQNSTYYSEYFTNEALRGKAFDLDILNNDLNKVSVRKVLFTYDTEKNI